MKNIIIFKRLIFIVILFLTTNVLADYPNIPKDLDKNFCDKKGGKFVGTKKKSKHNKKFKEMYG